MGILRVKQGEHKKYKYNNGSRPICFKHTHLCLISGGGEEGKGAGSPTDMYTGRRNCRPTSLAVFFFFKNLYILTHSIHPMEVLNRTLVGHKMGTVIRDHNYDKSIT